MPNLPNFDATTFQPGTLIDNPYFPLIPGTVFSYEATEDVEKTEDVEEVLEEIEDILEEVEDSLEDLEEEGDFDDLDEIEEHLEEIEDSLEDLEDVEDLEEFADDLDDVEDTLEEIADTLEDLEEGEDIDNPEEILDDLEDQLEEVAETLDEIEDELENGGGESSESESSVVESNQVFVTFETQEILGVEAVVVRDVAWEDGKLVEDTLDWYAQDTDGNVWYLGEHSTNYEYDDEGNLIGTNNDGSWEAGVDGALPGYLMEANPQVGDNYYQEFYLGEAEDQGEIISLDESISLGFGDFENVLQIRDFTELEPDVFEYKYYAPGIGQILADEGITEEGGDPELSPELVDVSVFDTITFGDNSDDILKGDHQNNLLNGSLGDDRLVGKSGNDSLDGSIGDDTVIGGSGHDQLIGSVGDDKLIGGSGIDFLDGGTGDDKLTGGSGYDTLLGGDGDDKLAGGSGSDFLDGGTGNNKLIGGSDADIFVLDFNGGFNVIKDFNLGEDLIGLQGSLTYDQLSFSQNNRGTLIEVENETLAQVVGVETLTEATFTTL